MIKKQYAKYLKHKHKLVIPSGIFEGMKYQIESYGSAVIPKLLGIYESEIQFALRNILNEFGNEKHVKIIDIGAADGWYAVGLARFPQIENVIAFESSKTARDLLNANAIQNNVESKIVQLGNFNDINDLKAISKSANEITILICDIEGSEALLLDVDSSSFAKQIDYFIIECHDHIVKNVGADLFSHLNASFKIRKIQQTNRSIKSGLHMNFLPKKMKLFFENEERKDLDCNYWLIGNFEL